MGEMRKNNLIMDSKVQIDDIEDLSAGYFRDNISFLSLPDEADSEEWTDEDWADWVRGNSDRILSSQVYFKKRIEILSEGAFENWSADKLVFEDGIGLIEDEGIFAGEVNSILIDGDVGDIGRGNFSNLSKFGLGLYKDQKGVNFIVNGDIARIREGAFSDSQFENLLFRGTISRIDDYRGYIVPSFSNLKVKNMILPRGLESLGQGNFYHSVFSYLSLPASLDLVDDLSFNDCIIGLLLVKSLDLDLGIRDFRGGYGSLEELPRVIGYGGSKIEDYAARMGYPFENIFKLNEFVEDVEESSFNLTLRLELNELIREREEDFSLDHKILVKNHISEDFDLVDLAYEEREGLGIYVEGNSLNIFLGEGLRLDEPMDLSLEFKNPEKIDYGDIFVKRELIYK